MTWRLPRRLPAGRSWRVRLRDSPHSTTGRRLARRASRRLSEHCCSDCDARSRPATRGCVACRRRRVNSIRSTRSASDGSSGSRQAGDRVGAISNIGACRAVRRELGVAPLARDDDLYDAIREGRQRSAVHPRQSVPADPEEFRPLDRSLDRTADELAASRQPGGPRRRTVAWSCSKARRDRQDPTASGAAVDPRPMGDRSRQRERIRARRHRYGPIASSSASV